MQRICLGRTVVYALRASQSGSPARGARTPSGRFMEVLFFDPKAALTPFQKLAPCSSAVFMTFTAMG